MTASIIGGASGATPVSVPFGPFAGFRPLLRKDATEWMRARRTWVILAVSGLFMVLAAGNAWLIRSFAAALPPGEAVQGNLGSVVPADNVLAAVATQIFSRSSANVTTSGVLSNAPRYLRPCVHAKIDAIGFVDVGLPFWCSR